MAHFNLGNTYQDMKNLPLAITCFQEVLLLETGHADALFNLGVAFQDYAAQSPQAVVENLKSALDCYEKVIDLQTEDMGEDAKKASAHIRKQLSILDAKN